MRIQVCLIIVLALYATLSVAAELTATIHRISKSGIHESLGKITVTDGGHGLIVKPDVRGLSPGPHAFHIHERGDCGTGEKDGQTIAGFAAGGHYGHSAHKKAGHDKPAGDLPGLNVAADGTATTPVMHHHLTAAEIAGRAIMIHAHSEAEGAGARVACGVFPK